MEVFFSFCQNSKWIDCSLRPILYCLEYKETKFQDQGVIVNKTSVSKGEHIIAFSMNIVRNCTYNNIIY